MRCVKVLLLLLYCLLQANNVAAQGRPKSFYTRDRHNFKAPVVGHRKAKTICPIFENSKYPYQGVGFKVGDPFAFTYKLYPNKHWAFVADIGKPASSLYSSYFREDFIDQSSKLLPGQEGIEYLSHKIKTDFVIDVRVLYQLDADKLAKGLQFYSGVGWEVRNTNIQYDYLYETGVNENDFGRFSNKRNTQGLQGVLGIEYSYFQIPVSAFIEMEYYVDIIQRPGSAFLQGGIGLRYVF